MKKLIKMERVHLKDNPDINENKIQNFISDNPSVLGLGDLVSLELEKKQPHGGRLDLLLADEDGSTRYEVEIQLGATDPSHIIRTIEYWDVERKRYPQYAHCAVIIAEEITRRFMNVISLFNGTIPLIAIQLSAYKQGDDYSIAFTKVLDRILPQDDNNEQLVVTDRKYWENKSTPAMLECVDKIYGSLGNLIEGYVLKYNKFYISIIKNGLSKNFLVFRPKKSVLHLTCRGESNEPLLEKLENEGLDIDYDEQKKEYKLTIKSFSEYEQNKSIIDEMIKNSMEYMNVTE